MKTLIEVLDDARRRRVAVGHFNFSDLVAFNAIVAAARDLKVPVMVGVSEGERAFVGVAQAAALVRSVREQSGLPIFLNADHTHSLGKAEEAARAGFDEVIFDASALPFEENVKQTRRAVEALKSINPAIVVEGEIGNIGASSEILEKVPDNISALTTAAEAQAVYRSHPYRCTRSGRWQYARPAAIDGARRSAKTPRPWPYRRTLTSHRQLHDLAWRLGH